VPPHIKRCGLTGTCFLDAQSVDYILKNVVLRKHFDIKYASIGVKQGFDKVRKDMNLIKNKLKI